MAKVVVTFDFDRTIIDGDSDNWIVTKMGLTHLFDQHFSTMPWNSLMVTAGYHLIGTGAANISALGPKNRWMILSNLVNCIQQCGCQLNYPNKMMEELYLQGKTIDDIRDCLKEMPLDPQIISAIKSAHYMGCDLRVVSDANQFFIETILKHHGLFVCFMEIITNPTYVDNGMLRILPYHDLKLSPHGCSFCPSNMCKGMILECIQADDHGKNTFIYLGDGAGDYCPTLKLGERDHVMPRTKFPLWDRINRDPSLIKAKIHEWSNGEELRVTLLHLVNKSIAGNNSICASQIRLGQ